MRADQIPEAMIDEFEVVDAEPVVRRIAAPQAVEPARPAGTLTLRASQAVALTLSSVAAGALTVLFGRRFASRRPGLRRRGSRVGGKVVASRSFVVDVHLLDRR